MFKRFLVTLLFPFATFYIMCIMLCTGVGLISGYFYVRYGDSNNRFNHNIDRAFKVYDRMYGWAK